MYGAPKVNCLGFRTVTEQSDQPILNELPQADETGMSSWLRWWHWLVLVGLFLAGFAYFPLWRFDQRWNRLQVGDSLERVKELLGEPGRASYTVVGLGPGGNYEGYVFRRYWRSYEVIVSSNTHAVLSKTVYGITSPQPASNRPAVGSG